MTDSARHRGHDPADLSESASYQDSPDSAIALLDDYPNGEGDPGDVRPHSADLDFSTVDDAAAGPACPHCGAANQDTSQSWCRKCGFYDKLGTCVELTDWDREPEEEEEELEESQFSQNPSYLDVLKMVPTWGWVLLGLVSAILLVSGLVRLLHPGVGGLRTSFSLTLLSAGGLALFAAHLRTYILAAADDSRVALMDFFLRPLTVWAHAISELPRTAWRLQMAVCGLTAVLAALLIVGGLPWDVLWDWGIEERARPNLISAVTDLAGEQNGEADMEEALEEFADQGTRAVQNGEDEESDAGVQGDVIEAREESIDCLIVGYYPKANDDNDFAGLLVAAMVDGQLSVVATVSEGIPAEVRQELMQRFGPLERATPFVRTTANARWLQPRITCRVQFSDWSRAHKLENPLFEKLLAEIDL